MWFRFPAHGCQLYLLFLPLWFHYWLQFASSLVQLLSFYFSSRLPVTDSVILIPLGCLLLHSAIPRLFSGPLSCFSYWLQNTSYSVAVLVSVLQRLPTVFVLPAQGCLFLINLTYLTSVICQVLLLPLVCPFGFFSPHLNHFHCRHQSAFHHQTNIFKPLNSECPYSSFLSPT